MPQRSYNP